MTEAPEIFSLELFVFSGVIMNSGYSRHSLFEVKLLPHVTAFDI